MKGGQLLVPSCFPPGTVPILRRRFALSVNPSPLAHYVVDPPTSSQQVRRRFLLSSTEKPLSKSVPSVASDFNRYPIFAYILFCS